MDLEYKRIKKRSCWKKYFELIDILRDVSYVMYRMIYVKKKKKMVEDGK